MNVLPASRRQNPTADLPARRRQHVGSWPVSRSEWNKELPMNRVRKPLITNETSEHGSWPVSRSEWNKALLSTAFHKYTNVLFLRKSAILASSSGA